MRDDKAVLGFSHCSTDNLDILAVYIQCVHGYLLHTQQTGGLIAGSESGVLYKGQKLPQQMRQTTEHRCQESCCQERF